jgi:hypothetical protein
VFDSIHLHLVACGNQLAGPPGLHRARGWRQAIRIDPARPEVGMGRLQKALDAGWDPAELREHYNARLLQRSMRRRWPSLSSPRETVLSRPELEAYIDQLGDTGKALYRTQAEERRQLYESLRLSLIYHQADQIVDIEVDQLADRVDNYRLRGAIRTLTMRISLNVE